MSENPIYSSPVIDMVTISAEYCVFMEKLREHAVTRRSFLDKISKVLPLLYVKAALLPDLEEMGFDDLEELVSEEDYEDVRKRVWSLLRADDEYLEVFTPDMQYSEGPMMCTISEDLADIYQDLKNFVAAFASQNEESMNNAIVKVKENFRTYWGQRLVNAMRPIHDLTYGDHAVTEEEEDE